jgi:predicted negative regulator of RcsB-dependent stress response
MPQIAIDSKTINLNKIIIIVIILILLVGNIYFGFRYFSTQKELKETKAAMEVPKINEKILSFTNLFIAKVLKAENEVDFETRLQLETAVRDINDKEILEQWQKFTGSQTEVEAQTEVKNLLELLVSKIKK